MPTVPYPCEARSIDAFLAQVVRYVSSGHYFYIRFLMSKNPPNPPRNPDEDDTVGKKKSSPLQEPALLQTPPR